MEPTPRGHRVLATVRSSLRLLLRPPDFRAQTLRLVFAKTFSPLFSIISDLHQRCAVVQPLNRVLERKARANTSPSNGTFTSCVMAGSQFLIREMFLVADIHSWSRSAIQYLGWEVGGDEHRPNEGSGRRS